MISKNLYSRTCEQITIIMKERIETNDLERRTNAQIDLARFRSAGGKLASTFLELLPKRASFEMRPLLMPSHLFTIALRLRMGTNQDPDIGNGRRCRCKEEKKRIH